MVWRIWWQRGRDGPHRSRKLVERLFFPGGRIEMQDALAMVRKTVETYGHLDCAFNNAGVGIPGSTVDCAEEDWDRVLQINLKGVWLCMKHEIPQMLKQGVDRL
jgi:NAD(P)-dependent dehydrogenase (short-subunit alcohol dehydrogenase family)